MTIPVRYKIQHISSRIKLFLQLFRFRSWMSWLFIYGFGSTIFIFPSYETIPIAIAFSSVTASVFVVNQYFDAESDRSNPSKRRLPLASGKVSKSSALCLSICLLTLGLFTTLLANVDLIYLLLLYFGLWLAYSCPPLCLKSKPLVDILIAGLGSGVFPFLIGLQASHQLTMDFNFPWIVRRYQDAIICVIPIFLFQIAGQLFQVIGDYDTDKREKITTFAVKYGKENSARIGVLLFTASSGLPIVYGLLDLTLTKEFLYWYIMMFVVCLPFAIFLLNLFRKPKTENLNSILRIINTFSPLALLIVYICIILLRFSLI